MSATREHCIGIANAAEAFVLPAHGLYLDCAAHAPMLRSALAAGHAALDAPPWTRRYDAWEADLERLRALAGDVLFEAGSDPDKRDTFGRKLDVPEDDSALGYYRRALALDPENARARAGVANIVNFYRRYGHEFCQRGRWGTCGLFASKGLEIDPEDAYLLQLQEAAVAGQNGETPALPPAPAG